MAFGLLSAWPGFRPEKEIFPTLNLGSVSLGDGTLMEDLTWFRDQMRHTRLRLGFPDAGSFGSFF
jgi:hypothetical protein